MVYTLYVGVFNFHGFLPPRIINNRKNFQNYGISSFRCLYASSKYCFMVIITVLSPLSALEITKTLFRISLIKALFPSLEILLYQTDHSYHTGLHSIGIYYKLPRAPHVNVSPLRLSKDLEVVCVQNNLVVISVEL